MWLFNWNCYNISYEKCVRSPIHIRLGLVKFGYFNIPNQWEFCIDVNSNCNHGKLHIPHLYNLIKVTTTLKTYSSCVHAHNYRCEGNSSRQHSSNVMHKMIFSFIFSEAANGGDV